MSHKGPSPLTDQQELAAFSSGDDILDDWLRRRARANQASGASRTYVLCRERRAVGYYALASGGLALAGGPGRFRRNMPDPIPVVVLGRLAVDRSEQGRGLGRALFQDAALRTLHASETIGVRGLLVHAISPAAQAFYLALGLEPSPLDPMTLMATLDDLRASMT